MDGKIPSTENHTLISSEGVELKINIIYLMKTPNQFNYHRYQWGKVISIIERLGGEKNMKKSKYNRLIWKFGNNEF